MTPKITFIIFLLIAVSAHSQDTNKKTFFGIGAGLNFTNSKAGSYFISEPAYYNYYKSSPRPGFSIKTTLDIPFEKQLSLKTCLDFNHYIQKQEYSTYKTLDEPGSSNNHDKITVNTLALSPLFKYEFKSFSLVGGPKIEYIISAKTKNLQRSVSPYTGPQDNEQTYNFKKAKKVNNPMLGINVGVERNFGKNFMIGLHYQLSFTNVADYYFASRITKLKGLELYIIHYPRSKLK